MTPTVLVGETFVRPAQWATPRDASPESRGVRALYARMLRGTLVEAGLAPYRVCNFDAP